MKINSINLIGETLDWAVIECEKINGHALLPEGSHPSTNWTQGGPILEREKIVLLNPTFENYFATEYPWLAWKDDVYGYGETVLIAVLRCYVANTMGTEVDVPNHLMK